MKNAINYAIKDNSLLAQICVILRRIFERVEIEDVDLSCN